MPKTKRPRRSATLYAKGGHPRTTLAPAKPILYDDPLLRSESAQVDATIRYADGGDRPDDFTSFEIDPRLGDVWFRRAAVFAFATQVRAMIRGLREDATHNDMREANVAARTVQDRLFGKPIEKLAVAGRVKIEFGASLNPDVFPREPQETQAEVVVIDGATGTEAPDDDD